MLFHCESWQIFPVFTRRYSNKGYALAWQTEMERNYKPRTSTDTDTLCTQTRNTCTGSGIIGNYCFITTFSAVFVKQTKIYCSFRPFSHAIKTEQQFQKINVSSNYPNAYCTTSWCGWQVVNQVHQPLWSTISMKPLIMISWGYIQSIHTAYSDSPLSSDPLL